MNAPEGGILLQQPTIPLTSIVLSKTNPRKHIDKEKLAQLTTNVKAKGIINPILVRPLKDGVYEVVAGERRFRAAKAAMMVEIPATVKPLTDAEALELQVIENNQREDLHPLEEAEGFEALLKCKHPDGERYTVDDIAKKVDKSKSYVYQKLKLCACCPEVRKAFYDDKIDFSRALLIARIHGDNLQREALKEITSPYLGGEPMSFRVAQRHVQERYMLALDKAPFSTTDESLVPKVGACTTCPKRTGNAPELFPDVKSGDMCTDSECFGKKRSITLERVRDEAIANGHTVIRGKAAIAIMPNEHGPLQNGYARLAEKCWEDPKQRSYAQLVGKEVKPALLEDAQGRLIEVVKLADLKSILKEKGAVKEPRASASGSGKAAKASPPREDPVFVRRKRIFTHVCAALPKKLSEVELRWIVEELLMTDADHELIEELFFPGGKGPRSPGVAQARIEKAVPKLDLEGLTRLAVATLLSQNVAQYGDDTRLLAAAKAYSVDVDAIDAALKAEKTDKAKAEAKPKKKAKK